MGSTPRPADEPKPREREPAPEPEPPSTTACPVCGGRLFLRVGRQVLGNSDDAQDAAQAVFLVLARKAGSIRNRGSVAPWLHGVACRVAAKARQRSAVRRANEARTIEAVASARGEAV